MFTVGAITKMPIINSFDHEKHIIYSRCTGKMSLSDFNEYVVRVWSNTEHYGYNEIFDTTDADWEAFDFSFLFTVAKNAAQLKTIDPTSKLAWVVKKGKQHELTNFYKNAKAMLPVESRSLEAFFNESDAMTWLES